MCVMKYGELNLGQVEAIVNKLGGMDGVKRFLSGEVLVRATNLLKQVAKASVSDIKRFLAKDNLKAANVVWMNDNFKRLFLEKVEENVSAAELCIHRLEKDSCDPEIMAELGEGRREIALAHFFKLLTKQQAKGSQGPLLTNGWANIAYIMGSDGSLWAVRAGWHRDGWYVDACSVEGPNRWYAGDQVVSR